MAGMAAMAPLALSAGAALIGSAGYVGEPVVTPYGVTPVVDPVDRPGRQFRTSTRRSMCRRRSAAQPYVAAENVGG